MSRSCFIDSFGIQSADEHPRDIQVFKQKNLSWALSIHKLNYLFMREWNSWRNSFLQLKNLEVGEGAGRKPCQLSQASHCSCLSLTLLSTSFQLFYFVHQGSFEFAAKFMFRKLVHSSLRVESVSSCVRSLWALDKVSPKLLISLFAWVKFLNLLRDA